jgi:predicted transcriptional regulator
MKTTTIALEEDTHWRLRQLALDQRTSFREVIRTAIAEYLRRHEGGRS